MYWLQQPKLLAQSSQSTKPSATQPVNKQKHKQPEDSTDQTLTEVVEEVDVVAEAAVVEED